MATEISQLIGEGVARLGRVTDQPRHEAEILLAAALVELAHLPVHASGGAHPRLRSHRSLRVAHHAARARRTDRVHPAREGILVVAARGDARRADPASRDGTRGRTGAGSAAAGCAGTRARPRVGQWRDRACDRPRAAAPARDRHGHLTCGSLDCRQQRRAAGLKNIEFRTGSWYAPLPGEHFTLIVSNPPYIADDDPRVERGVRRFEPHAALYSGADGLERAARRDRPVRAGTCCRGGWLDRRARRPAGRDGARPVRAAGFESVLTHPDLGGHERCTEAPPADWAAASVRPRDLTSGGRSVHYSAPFPALPDRSTS